MFKKVKSLAGAAALLFGAASPAAAVTMNYAKALNEDFYYSTDSICRKDLTKKGYGCVSGELSDYGFNPVVYLPNVMKSTLLMISDEPGGSVFLYLYRNKSSENYDRVTLSTSLKIDEATQEYVENWKDYALKIVSFSSSESLCKYEIVGLNAGTAATRRYAVAKTFLEATKDDINTILEVALEFVLTPDPADPTKSITQTNKLYAITVVDTFNAFQLMRISNTDNWEQIHYAVFNLSKDLSKITKIELQYNFQPYICTTNIRDTVEDAFEDRFTYGFKGPENCRDGVNWLTDAKNKKITVEPEEKIITSDGFGWARRKYKWATIAKTADLSDKLVNSDIKSQYSNFVNFAQNTVHASRNFKEPFAAYYDLTDPVRPAYQITALNFLTFWFLENGEIKSAIAIDRYTDSSGNVPIIEGEKKIFSDILKDIFNRMPWLLAIIIVINICVTIFVLVKIINIFESNQSRKEMRELLKVSKAQFKHDLTKHDR